METKIEEWKEGDKPVLYEVPVVGKTPEEEFKKHDEELKKKIDASGFTSQEITNIRNIQANHGILKITNYFDNVQVFHKHHPFFYDKNCIFWFWNFDQNKYEIIDETDVMNKIDLQLRFGGETVTGGLKHNYLEAFKRVGRLHIPKPAPVKWIQLKDRAFSIKSRNVYKVEPNYFFTNSIPHKLGTSDETPTMDKLFEEWVGKEYIQTLYEIIAYCCYREYPIQVLFCLYGIGRNGKTCFLRLLSKFLGKSNITSTDLDLLFGNHSSRFESFKLYKKLCCVMGETNFGILNTSSLLKRLTGGDLIGFEMKGKQPFDDFSYAKLIIASNSLPSSEDTSEGFYRRWVIIPFENQFPEGKDILFTIPDQEYENLACKVTKILPKLLENGHFTNQGSVEERKHRYIMASNPLPAFIEECCYRDNPNLICSYSKFFSQYCLFLNKKKRRIVGKKEFSKMLNVEGLEHRRSSKDGIIDYYIFGVDLKLLPDLPDFRDFPLSYIEEITSIESMEITPIKQKMKPHYNDFNIENLKTHITNYPIDNIDDLELLFGKEQLTKWLKDGTIFESPNGTYKIL